MLEPDCDLLSNHFKFNKWERVCKQKVWKDSERKFKVMKNFSIGNVNEVIQKQFNLDLKV